MLQTTHFNVTEHVVPACHIREYPGLTANSQEEVLHLAVKQYTPREGLPTADDDGTTAVTLVAMHGDGFLKELYEPLWDELYEQSKSRGFTIRGIWMADMVAQGQSGVLNERKISHDNSWMDNSRDVLLMINHFRHLMPRPLVGVGHSCGGVQIGNLSHLHPRLFTSLIFLDPSFFDFMPGSADIPLEVPMAVRFLTYRRDTWRNRATAAAWFKSISPDWDPRTLELMAKYGFRDLPTALHPEIPADASDPPVTLTTTATQSVLTHARACFDFADIKNQPLHHETHPDISPNARVPVYRPETRAGIARLPNLRPPALFALGEHTDPAWWKKSASSAARTAGTGVGGSGGIAEGRVRIVPINSGHMLPFTAVAETGNVCAEWLGDQMAEFREKERIWQDERKNMTAKDHMVLPPRWKEVVRHPKEADSKL